MAVSKTFGSVYPSSIIEEVIRLGGVGKHHPPTTKRPPPPKYIHETLPIYRETISRPTAVDYTHRSAVNGVEQFARVNMTLEPLPPGSGFVFENSLPKSSMPGKYLRGIEDALALSAEHGGLAGSPTIDMKVTLLDGAYDLAASSVLAFRNATRSAFVEGVSKAAPKVVEPIVRLEVVAPHDSFDSVVDDLNDRQVTVIDTGARGDLRFVDVTVPLANLSGYAGVLDQKSNGRATYTAGLDHFAPLPKGRVSSLRGRASSGIA